VHEPVSIYNAFKVGGYKTGEKYFSGSLAKKL
jgi:hypothetical protein